MPATAQTEPLASAAEEKGAVTRQKVSRRLRHSWVEAAEHVFGKLVEVAAAAGSPRCASPKELGTLLFFLPG